MIVPEHYSYEIGFNSKRKLTETSVLFSGAGRPKEGHKIGPAVHDYFLIHTVCAGKGTFTIKGVQYHCGPGDSFVIFPGELFSYEADMQDPWVYMWVGFTGIMAGEMLRLAGITVYRPLIHGAYKYIYTCYRNMRNVLQSGTNALADIESTGYLRLLLAEFGKSNRKYGTEDLVLTSEVERRMDYAARFLETQYAQPISIELLADGLGYHRTYFSQLFKKFTGQSPKQYLVHVRMQQAKLLLISTSLSIDQIAGAVGYNDSLYFSKHFHQWSGISPTSFRKMEDFQAN